MAAARARNRARIILLVSSKRTGHRPPTFRLSRSAYRRLRTICTDPRCACELQINGSEAQMRFRDRTEAGQRLATMLSAYAGTPDVLVLGLPRGGVPVAYEISRALGAPLDVFVVRKLGMPGHEELAMGAIASGGARVLNGDVIREL